MAATTRFTVLLGLLLVACSGGGGGVTSEPPETTPQTTAQVTTPTSRLEVTATIAAATLGDECANGASAKKGSGFAAGDCAPTPADAGSSGNCGGICRASNMQLSFTSTASGQVAKVDIAKVTLHDDNGAELATLTASAPKAWDGSGYAAWDETVAPSANIKASYTLSSPEWSKISSSLSARYRIRVSLRIDGVAILLESALLNREPEVAT